MPEDAPAARVEHNAERNRYEIYLGDDLAGFSRYHDSGNRIVFTHTEIDESFAGRGLGKVLAAGALDDAVERDKVIVPLCPFIARYVDKHSDRYAGRVQAPPEATRE